MNQGMTATGFSPVTTPAPPPRFRWVCRCQSAGVLLATFDAGGTVTIKCRDRYYRAGFPVHAICPRCGAEHVLDPRTQPEETSR